MINRFAKIALDYTALFPVIIVFAIGAFLTDKYFIAAILFVGSMLLLIICQVVVKFALKKLEKHELNVTSIEAVDSENGIMLLLYLVPLFTVRF